MSTAVADDLARQLADVALNRDEYNRACDLMGRRPNAVELGIIGAMWSEHCGYKTSKPMLSRLPTTGPGVLQGPGENAGAVDIGNGLAVVFKIESHNHPSAIEPYEGAATGVGGILRDVFTMGARPVALLNSLRFGKFDEPEQRRLLNGVVAGIGGYGNCIGVPTVGGEVYFDDSYRYNCLVNAMCVGVIDQKKLTRAVAKGAGNPVLLVGADTGRDGIHGATFASVAMDDSSEQRRPAVQVGNPFLEKCLMEACLELAGHPRVVAIQDLGAAGLTSSVAELAHRGGAGIDIDIEKVSRREKGMSPYEVMLSESQERMLIVVEAGHEDEVRGVFQRWDLHSDVIGHITSTGRMIVRDTGDTVVDLSLGMLIDEVPIRHLRVDAPVRSEAVVTPSSGPDHTTALLALLADANIGSRRPIFRRYDHQVGDGTVIVPGGDAALVRVEGTNTALALSTDGNGSYCDIDPKLGASIAVCEAARNVVATGARPLAVTNCLNFGNPEDPLVYWQLSQSIDGIAEACTALGVPVVSGNVSLYNDTNGVSIAPTPVIGMVGLLDDLARRMTVGFKNAGDIVALIGPMCESLDGSVYASHFGGVTRRLPFFDLDMETAVQRVVLGAIRSDLLLSAHDCAEGGVAVALAESAISGDVGARIDATLSAAELFGESQSRFVVSYAPENAAALRRLAQEHGVGIADIGIVGGDGFALADSEPIVLSHLARVYEFGTQQPRKDRVMKVRRTLVDALRDDERMHEECGIFGVYAHDEDVATLTYFGLYALQHRGQESAGIGVSDGEAIRSHRAMGLVASVFDQQTLDDLTGHIAIGHTRYSTMGSAHLPNAQPMRFEHPTIGSFLLAHNGNLVNAQHLHEQLLAEGVTFDSSSDTEVLGHLLARTAGSTLEEILTSALPQVEGAYCLMLLSKDALVAARDPMGIRPLCLGQLNNLDTEGGDGYILASETCALDVVGARFVSEVEPGEIVVVTQEGVSSSKIPNKVTTRAMCSFELIYFARPDSVMMGRSLYEARRSMGRELAAESPTDADIVITLPDSGTPAAIGYSEASGIPFAEGLIKSRYITRTFIQPSQRMRDAATRLKFNPLKHILEGKRVVLVDDSIVRGTTSKRIVEELRRAGAKEVHMRIASPPIAWPCFMGIDIANRNELVAANHDVAGISKLVGADTLVYLSLDGLRRAMGRPDGDGYCFACFTGAYPVTVPASLHADKLALET